MKSRLHHIAITNFKAFRDFQFNLESRHLLIYGANGSGKSSLYWALYTFLQSAQKQRTEIAKYFDPAAAENLLNIHEQKEASPKPGEIALTLRDTATRDDGEVRYNFTAPKQVLEIFRAVCQDQTEPHARLCKLFDRETAHGQDMSRYGGLLDKAVAAIAAQFGRKNAGKLFSGRGGKLLGSHSAIKTSTDFDLITWLVIKDAPNA